MKKYLFLLMCVAKHATFAQSLAESTTVPLYRITFDTRAAGMGKANTIAGTPDNMVMFSNLAKLPSVMNTEEGWEHTKNMFAGGMAQYNAVIINYLGYAHADKDGNDFCAIAKYLNGGNPQQAFLAGNDNYEWDIEMGYAKSIGDAWSVSVMTKLLQSETNSKAINTFLPAATVSADALSLDLGAYYADLSEIGAGTTIGFMLSNLGTPLNYGHALIRILPATVGAGISHTWIEGVHNNAITTSFEVNKSLSFPFPGPYLTLSGGFEYSLRTDPVKTDGFSIRMGYCDDSFIHEYSGITIGIGIGFRKIHLDMASFIDPSGRGESPLYNKLHATISYGL